jgi:VanZ family protein
MKRIYLPLPFILAYTVLFFIETSFGPSTPAHQLNGIGHLLYFILLTWWIAYLPSVSRLRFPRQIALILAMVLVVGIAIELIQPYFGRNKSWSDMVINLLGGLIGLLFLTPCRRYLGRGLLISSQLAVLIAAGIIFYGPAITLWDMQQAARQFPMLSDFETRLQTNRWSRGSIDPDFARHGRASLRVELKTQRYSGTTLRRSLGNWEGYSIFAFSIHNPDPEPLAITVSIRDQEHHQRGGQYNDRFSRSFELKQGWNDLRIPVEEIKNAPLSRSQDLTMLREVGIFTMDLTVPRVIHLDHVRLIP